MFRGTEGESAKGVVLKMAEAKRNKFTYDRNYYENLSRGPVEGSVAKQYDVKEEYEEDFFEDSELFTEEYSEYDFETTSPRKIERERVRETERFVETRSKVKLKKKYNFGFIELLMLIIALGALVRACYGYIEARADIIQANKRITSAKQELKDIQNINNSLMGQLDVEVDRNYIYTVAVSKLNMIYPKENNTIYYEKPEDGYVRQYHEIPAVKN